jgi:hypothetical protein
MIVDTLKGTLRDMSRLRRRAIRIATKKARNAVMKKVTKPAKAARIPKLYILGNLIRTWSNQRPQKPKILQRQNIQFSAFPM